MSNNNINGGAAATVVALGCLAVIFGVVTFILALWALIFGIWDLVAVGPNFWNIFWIVVGGLWLIRGLFSNRSS